MSVSKTPEMIIHIRSTFEVFGREKNGANMVIFDQRLDLVIDSRAVEAHHEELAQLSIATISMETTMSMMRLGQTCQSHPKLGQARP
jgi:pyruvate/2-oxoglutarate dehydrogenase complex dihydrolipoamide dehydrogenase (E3) component